MSIISAAPAPYIEALLQQDPWRRRPGIDGVQCTGEVQFDGGPKWLCVKCGRISGATTLQHAPARNVLRVLLNAAIEVFGSK